MTFYLDFIECHLPVCGTEVQHVDLFNDGHEAIGLARVQDRLAKSSFAHHPDLFIPENLRYAVGCDLLMPGCHLQNLLHYYACA